MLKLHTEWSFTCLASVLLISVWKPLSCLWCYCCLISILLTVPWPGWFITVNRALLYMWVMASNDDDKNNDTDNDSKNKSDNKEVKKTTMTTTILTYVATTVAVVSTRMRMLSDFISYYYYCSIYYYIINVIYLLLYYKFIHYIHYIIIIIIIIIIHLEYSLVKYTSRKTTWKIVGNQKNSTWCWSSKFNHWISKIRCRIIPDLKDLKILGRGQEWVRDLTASF